VTIRLDPRTSWSCFGASTFLGIAILIAEEATLVKLIDRPPRPGRGRSWFIGRAPSHGTTGLPELPAVEANPLEYVEPANWVQGIAPQQPVVMNDLVTPGSGRPPSIPVVER
jgi:hypothetical protein